MQHGRMALLALSLLSACAATDPGVAGAQGGGAPTGEDFADYIVGRYAAARGDMGTAADRLRAASARNPADHALASQAFSASLLAGRGDLAALAPQVSDSLLAQLYLADEMARAGRWNAAERRYAALPEQGLTGALRPLLVAWTQQGAGQTDAALATLRPLAAGQALRGVYTLHMALIADQAGRAGDAAELYQTARQAFPSLNLRLGIVLASAEARRGLTDEAHQTIAALAAGNPDLAIAEPALDAAVAQPAVPRAVDGIAETYLAFAAALRESGANDLAQALLRLALLDRPDFTAARILLSEAQDAAKQPGAALATLRGVPAADPLHSVAELRETVLLDELGDHAAAVALAADLARAYPTRPEPLAQEGEALRMEQHFADAAAAYDQAIARAEALGPVPWTLYFERGISREQAGNWARAQADLERAVQLAPDQPTVLNYLAYAWVGRHEHLPRAREMLERAVAINPNDGSVIDSLGWVMLSQGDAADAIRQLERAVELEPEDPVINGHLGDAYLAAGRRREAEFQWRRALTLKPKDADKARIEAKLSDLGQP